ncbi:hypothetical protein VTH06DRAFT_3788 [Thermothelomyces fergusii]
MMRQPHTLSQPFRFLAISVLRLRRGSKKRIKSLLPIFLYDSLLSPIKRSQRIQLQSASQPGNAHAVNRQKR